MKKTIIYLLMLVVIGTSVIMLSGFEWYGDEEEAIKQGEVYLEEISGIGNLKYLKESPDGESYVYTDENSTIYMINKTDGSLKSVLGNDEKLETKIADDEQLKSIIKQKVLQYYSDFYDTGVEYEVKEYSNFKNIYVYQLSKLGNRTGNFLFSRIENKDTIANMIFCMNGDKSLADEEVKISESNAIKIAYEGAKNYMLEVRQELIEQQTVMNPEQTKAMTDEVAYNDQGDILSDDVVDNDNIHVLEVYLEDTESHDVTTTKTIKDGIALWVVQIENVKNNMPGVSDDHTMGIVVTINAETGEILSVDYSL